MEETVKKLLSNDIWCASSLSGIASSPLPSGFPALDSHLSGGGWPEGGVTEIMHDRHGIGELHLTMPAIAKLSHSQERWIIWLSPPFLPYPPALAMQGVKLSRLLVVTPKNKRDLLWATEQAMSSGNCSAILLWQKGMRNAEIRRLQFAASQGKCSGFLFRPTSAAKHASPAELRIRVEPGREVPSLVDRQHTLERDENRVLSVTILKRRGGWETGPFPVPLMDYLHRRPYVPLRNTSDRESTIDWSGMKNLQSDGSRDFFSMQPSEQRSSSTMMVDSGIDETHSGDAALRH